VSSSIFVHETALVESSEIGAHTRIWAFAHVLAGARIGSNCNIGDHAFIESGAVVGNNVTLKNQVCVWDGVTLEDDVFVGPAVVFTNDLRPRSPRMPAVEERYASKSNWLVPTVVERGATIGAGAIVLAGVCLGRYCFVAAGAVVTKDVDPFALIVGAPAKKAGYVCRCGQRLNGSFPAERCDVCGTTAEFFQHNLQLKSHR
jgi:acetyltransferase-like isoleucine patch superfamily enzyme